MSRVVVIAKVPTPGRSKTRLIPALGAEGAAALAAAMSADVLRTVRAAGLPWSVAVDGDLGDPWVQALDAPFFPQAPGDLGVRLTHALVGGGIAIGTDAPTLPPDLLHAAAAHPADVVFIPTFDGGYALIRTRATLPGLFDGVPWSCADTLAASVARARGLGCSVGLLPFWYDIDEPADLDFLRRHLSLLPPDVAPHTRALLEPYAPPLR